MTQNTKQLRPRDMANDAAVLSPLDDLAPLPAPYDRNGLEPPFKEPKPAWAEEHCASLDGFVALDTLKRPETQEEEEAFVLSFLNGLEKLFADSNKRSLQPLMLTMEYCAKCNTCSEACHVFQGSNGDEIYRPSFRVDVLRRMYKKHFTPGGKLMPGFVGADVDVTWESIARLGELAYRCNLCRRCAQTCPLGLDNGLAAKEIRKLFSQEMGIAPTPVHAKGTQLQLKTGSTTGLTKPALIDTSSSSGRTSKSARAARSSSPSTRRAPTCCSCTTPASSSRGRRTRRLSPSCSTRRASTGPSARICWATTA